MRHGPPRITRERVPRLATAAAALPATAVTIAGLVAAATAILNSAYGSGPPAQNDVTTLNNLQAAAQAAVNSAYSDFVACATYWNVALQ